MPLFLKLPQSYICQAVPELQYLYHDLKRYFFGDPKEMLSPPHFNRLISQTGMITYHLGAFFGAMSHVKYIVFLAPQKVSYRMLIDELDKQPMGRFSAATLEEMGGKHTMFSSTHQEAVLQHKELKLFIDDSKHFVTCITDAVREVMDYDAIKKSEDNFKQFSQNIMTRIILKCFFDEDRSPNHIENVFEIMEITSVKNIAFFGFFKCTSRFRNAKNNYALFTKQLLAAQVPKILNAFKDYQDGNNRNYVIQLLVNEIAKNFDNRNDLYNFLAQLTEKDIQKYLAKPRYNALSMYFIAGRFTAAVLQQILTWDSCENFSEVFDDLRCSATNMGLLEDYSPFDLTKLPDSDENNALDSFIKESMRFALKEHDIYRYAEKETQVGDLTLPAKSVVNLSLNSSFAFDRDEVKASEFMRDRFSRQGTKKEELEFANQFGFIPFSTGKRSCPGEMLANLILKIFLIELLKRKYPPKPEPEVTARELRPS